MAGRTPCLVISGLKGFYKYLFLENLMTVDPTEMLESPKIGRKLPNTLSVEEIDLLINSIDLSKPEGERNKAILETLYGCGLRVTELVNVRISNIFFNEGFLKVTGKGNKERVVPIGISVQKALLKYLTKFRPKQAHPNFTNIFLNRDGMPLTPNRVQTIIEIYSKKAGIKGIRASPHTFRHTFAVSYLRNGGDMFTLQRILGHESLDMVRNYVNVTQYDLQRAHLLHSPADNIRFHLQDKR